jgi:hypothetical protein
MYLYFEDWSQYIPDLEAKGLPHGDHIIKVMTSTEDPRSETLFNRSNIAIFEVDDSPFSGDEIFRYEGRGEFSGQQLEEKILELKLSTAAAARLRALFRFANSEGLRSTQTAMQLRNQEGDWLITHPFQDIDGFRQAGLNPNRLHLDIFVPESLDRIARLLNVDSLADAEGIVSFAEKWNLDKEIRRRGKEK